MVLEKTLESPLDCEEIQPINPKGNQSLIFFGRTHADAEAPILWPPDAESTHWKRSWCWERLKTGEEGDDRGQDGWMASLTRRTWVWASSGSWWWTGKPGMLQSMGSQRVRHNWVTELNWRNLPKAVPLIINRVMLWIQTVQWQESLLLIPSFYYFWKEADGNMHWSQSVERGSEWHGERWKIRKLKIKDEFFLL